MSSNMIWIFCGGFFIFVFFVGGVAAIIFGIRNRKKGTESQNWPKVIGKISRAEVLEELDTDEEGFTSKSYKPEIEYQYGVGDEEFTSTKVSFGGTRTYSSNKKAEEALTNYPLNGSVSVFYNPQDPSESVLVQGTKGTMGLIIVGIVFLAVSIITSCVGLIILISNL